MVFHNVVLMAQEDCAAEVLDGLREHAERSRQEPGCLRFEAHCAPTLPDTTILTECWESPEALAAHRERFSYRRIYAPLKLLLQRSPLGQNAVAFDFDRTLTRHASPVVPVVATLRHHARVGWTVWVVTARDPAYDYELPRNFDDPMRLLVTEAWEDWRLPIRGIRFTNNAPKILHLLELGCCCVVDDCPRTRQDALNHGLKAVDPAILEGC